MDGIGAPPTRDHSGPTKDIAGPICIATEAIMVLANILPILVVTRYKNTKDRITTDVIILALSITDILSVVVPAPFGLPAYFMQSWYGGSVTCYLYQLTSIWFQLASLCLVTLLCLDRWSALRRVINHRHPYNHLNTTRAIIGAIYIATLLVAALPLMGLAPQAMSQSGGSCRSWVILNSHSVKEHIFYVAFLVLGFVNLLVAIVINTHVISTLISLKREFGRNSADRRLNHGITNTDIDHRSTVEITTMAVVVTIVFYLAWLPVLVLITLQKIGCKVGGIAVLYALLSTTLTGLLNPVLYAAFSRTYRHGYIAVVKTTFRKICCCFYNPTGLRFIGAKDSIQWQMVNTVSNTSSLLGLLSQDQQNGSDSTKPDQPIRKPDTPSTQVPLQNGKALTHAVIENHEVNIHNVLDENGDVMDSGVFERTYFDDTLENYEDEEYPDHADIEDFYGSKLSLLSSNEEEDEEEETMMT